VVAIVAQMEALVSKTNDGSIGITSSFICFSLGM
jgi:hypothetical protein